ncbi:UNVERIFIED_CONTAM: hypothetical protein Sradi_3824700 [Sesamum radiatum]|uniref:Retrotransposon gag domain-containing protein n=1 Tax=Sesamum radiatum TaxID=300843 RepID=A0AAW2Q149_SESRA
MTPIKHVIEYQNASYHTGDLQFDPKIEKTARRLHWETKQQVEETSTSYEDGRDIKLDLTESSGESEEEIMTIIPERSIKEMTSLDLNQQPLCIEYPRLEVDFELKSGLIHLLSTFRGLAGEDPHKHLKEFHVVCSGIRPQGITIEQVKLRAFPFSLAEQAKDWLYFLPSRSITTWNDLKKQFLEKYFPASRATTIRKEISGIRQFAGESLYKYWDRFNELVKRCPHHQIPDHLLIQYFYEGLSGIDRKLIDAASEGALFNKTPTEARNLISIMASNTQQFGTRYDDPSKRSNKRPKYRPPMPPPPTNQGTSLEEMMKALITNTQQFQQSVQKSIQHCESQMSQLAESVGQLESQGKFPSQPIVNPKHNASAIVLCNEKELQEYMDKNSTKCGHAQKRKPEKEVEIPQKQDDESKDDHPKILMIKLPFLERFAKSKKEEEEKEILETFQKVEVKIPFLDAIKQSLATRSFLKNCAPAKASSKEMNEPFSCLPQGVLEDILVQVNELVFPTDFYALDMREDNSPNSTSILLGRPFLKTARTKIDVHSGTLTMEFDGEIIRFNIFDSMRYPSDLPTALFVDVFDPFVQKFPAINGKVYMKFALEESPMPM